MERWFRCYTVRMATTEDNRAQDAELRAADKYGTEDELPEVFMTFVDNEGDIWWNFGQSDDEFYLALDEAAALRCWNAKAGAGMHLFWLAGQFGPGTIHMGAPDA